MNPFKFLALVALSYFTLVLIFGQSSESAPEPTVRIPQTIQIVPLTEEQIADQEALIAQMIAEENATIYDEPVETSTTLVQLARIDPDTKCQEWLPLAVEMGWPNRTEVLQTLGRVMWKETRCTAQIVSKTGDHGLTQVNATAHRSWAEEIFGIPFEEAMADPAKNLRFAFLLWNAREEAGKCGWQPWSISC